MPDDRIERPCSCRDRPQNDELVLDGRGGILRLRLQPDPDCPRCGGSGWLPTGPPPPGVTHRLALLERLERRYGMDALEVMAGKD